MKLVQEMIRDFILKWGKKDLPGCYQLGGLRLVRHNNMKRDSISLNQKPLFEVPQ